MSMTPQRPAPNAHPLDRPRRIDPIRLQAGLSLLLNPAVAAEVTARAMTTGDADEVIRRAARETTLHLGIQHVHSKLRVSTAPARDGRIVPGTLLTVQAMVRLALSLSVEENAEHLARALGTEVDSTGRDLLRARSEIAARIQHPCSEYDADLGRHRDPSLPANRRVRLFHHVSACPDCNEILQQFHRIDTELLAEIDQLAKTLAPPAPGAASWRRSARTFAPVASVLTAAIVLLTMAGIAVAGQIGTDPPAPVPLMTNPSSDPVTGWLLRTTADGRVEALHLETGERKLLAYSGGTSWWGGHFISPNGRQIATWRVTEGTATRGMVEIFGLDGEEKHSWWWAYTATSRYPGGWLDDSELLFTELPLTRQELSLEQSRVEDTRLIAADATTGDVRVLFEGALWRAVPSPDGQMIALTRPRDGADGAQSIEIRPVGPDGLGPPISVVESRYSDSVRGPVWASDSSRVFFTMISDEPDMTASTPRQQLVIAALYLDGRIDTLTEPRIDEVPYPIAVAPDNNRLVFVRRTPNEWSSWYANLDGTDQVQVTSRRGKYAWWDGGVVWSPDGGTMLMATAQPFYLTAGTEDPAAADVNGTLIMAIDDTRTGHIWHEFGFRGGILARWLPLDAIASNLESASNPSWIHYSDTEPVEDVWSRHLVDEDTVISPDRQYIVLGDRSGADSPLLIWNPASRSGREISLQGVRDMSWVFDSSAVIGAVRSDPETGNGSRLVFYSADLRGPSPEFHNRRFDPAGLGESVTHDYARPLVASDGETISFFVIDRSKSTASLWIANPNRDTRQVDSWPLPQQEGLEHPFVAQWVNSKTLLYAIPGDWREGLPRQVTLHRLRLDSDGPSVEQLVTIQARGNELGAMLTELVISPDGEQLTYRMRRITDRRDENTFAYFDSLHVVATSNLAAPIELIRGAPGEGLEWSPSGSLIVAGLRDRIALISPDGRRLSYISESGQTANHPTWVTPREIWFTQDDGFGPHVVRVLAHE